MKLQIVKKEGEYSNTSFTFVKVCRVDNNTISESHTKQTLALLIWMPAQKKNPI